MALPESGFLQMGHTLLRWQGSGARSERVVELEPARARLEAWIADGGLLGVQALHPVASWSFARRAAMTLLAAGPGAALAGLAAVAYGFQGVVVVLAEEDRGPFLHAARAMPGGGEASALAAVEQIEGGRMFHRVLLGCGGQAPDLAAAAPLIRRLHMEGHFALFGFPIGHLESAFERLAARGMHLRGSGFANGLALLAGSLENPDAFRP